VSSNNDVNDIRPTSLRHFIGQKDVVASLSVAIDSCFADNRPLEHCLLVGPPGVGKTEIASILASELATKCHEALGQSIRCHADLHALLLGAKNKHIVFIDEVHELPKLYQTSLYLAIDRRKISVCGTKSVRSIPLADFTLILGTTDEYSVLQPLRDRMKLVLRFDFYADDELAQIVRLRAKALEWELEETLPALISRRSRGTPRLALRLLQACRRVCRALGEEKIILTHLERACELERLDILGLGRTDQKYLEILAEGDSRLNVIASRLGLPSRTVSAVVEPFLIRAGLLIKDDQARRQLTAFGHEHVKRNSKDVVNFVKE
jgi:holliday junction DNA helicase RuvB